MVATALVEDEVAVAEEEIQYFQFAFEAVPGDPDPWPPQIQVVGPPSLTALVTEQKGSILLTLTEVGLPPGSEVYFDKDEPLTWHPFGDPGQSIPQPDWVEVVSIEPHRIQMTVTNPATSIFPVIVGFTPVVDATQGDPNGVVKLPVPDPTIVNIDPTGG